MQKRLKHIAVTDELTGLKNRRHIMEQLGEEYQRAVRTGGTLSLILLDIDHFKRSNDSYGHAIGDAVLKEVAQAMQASLRATLGCLRSFSSTDFRGELPAFKVPTLIIHGTEDKTVPIDASSRAAAKGIAGRTLIEYEGAPHGLFATHKARLTKDLLDFTGR